jgi:hypothetical protein
VSEALWCYRLGISGVPGFLVLCRTVVIVFDSLALSCTWRLDLSPLSLRWISKGIISSPSLIPRALSSLKHMIDIRNVVLMVIVLCSLIEHSAQNVVIGVE